MVSHPPITWATWMITHSSSSGATTNNTSKTDPISPRYRRLGGVPRRLCHTTPTQQGGGAAPTLE